MVPERGPAQKSKPKRRTEAPAPAVSPEILTPEEAAAYLRVSVRNVLAQARAGVLPGQRVGREWRFSRRGLLRWVEEGLLSEEFVDLALQAMAEEAIAEAGDWDGIPWEEVEERMDAGLASIVQERMAEASDDDFVPWEEVKRDLGL